MEIHTTLHNILKTKRNELLPFLLENGKYDVLKSALDKIKELNPENPHIISQLLLGKIGPELNKLKALYELPTDELTTIIQFICETLNVKHVEELCAGQGLLAALLKNKLSDEYVINATDGHRWIETSFGNPFYPINKKLFLEYCLDDEFTFDDKLLLISWLPINDMFDFATLLNIKKPKNIMIIGDRNNTKIYKIAIDKLKQLNYTMIDIPIKQIGCDDHETFRLSSTIFATLDENVSIPNITATIKFKYNNCLQEKQNNKSDIDLIKYIAKKHSLSFLEDSINDQNMAQLAKSFSFIIPGKMITPKYIQNYDEYKFWFEKVKSYRFPMNILSYEKFTEYMDYCNKINTPEGIQELKNDYVLPNWVTTKDIADKCLLYEFSYASKSWRESRAAYDRYRYGGVF